MCLEQQSGLLLDTEALIMTPSGIGCYFCSFGVEIQVHVYVYTYTHVEMRMELKKRACLRHITTC